MARPDVEGIGPNVLDELMGIGEYYTPEELAGTHSAGGASGLSLDEVTGLRKARRGDAIVAAGSGLPVPVAGIGAWVGGREGPGKGLYAQQQAQGAGLPAGSYVPETGPRLAAPKSTTESLQMRAAQEDPEALAMLDTFRRRGAARRSRLLPMRERGELMRARKGLPSRKAMDIAAGRALSLPEQEIAMRERAYTMGAQGEAWGGRAGVPFTPEELERMPSSGGGGGAGLPPAVPESREAYIERELAAGRGTLPEVEARADELYGEERGLLERGAETGQWLHENETYAQNFPMLKGLTEDIAKSMLPDEPPAAGYTEAQIKRLRDLAAGTGPKAAKARKLLADAEGRGDPAVVGLPPKRASIPFTIPKTRR
jgi:hypothetical protein